MAIGVCLIIDPRLSGQLSAFAYRHPSRAMLQRPMTAPAQWPPIHRYNGQLDSRKIARL
jgi:hypothetical protein